MGSEERALVSTAESARLGREGSRERADQATGPSRFRRGVVSAVGSKTCTVKVRDASDGDADTIEGVAMWTDDDPFDVGDKVLVFWEGDRPIPIAIRSAGSSSSLQPHGHTSESDGGLIGFVG